MKAIMLSIRPKYVSMILNKTKTIEVRKRFPKDYKGWVYIYCTKDNFKGIKDNRELNYRGKVVARFYCDKVEEIKKFPLSFEDYNLYRTSSLDFDDFEKTSCLSNQELNEYLKGKGYAIHISNLEIFDRPKELSEFKTKSFERIKVMGSPYGDLDSVAYHYEKKPILKSLTKAPQNYMFIEV